MFNFHHIHHFILKTVDMNPTYAVMVDKLSMLDLEEHIDTIIMQIVRPTENVAIELWTVDEVYNWVRKIDIGDEALMQRVAEILRDECVDGYTVMVVTEKEWTEHLCLDHRILQVIKIILQGWCLDADGLLSLREAIGDGTKPNRIQLTEFRLTVTTYSIS